MNLFAHPPAGRHEIITETGGLLAILVHATKAKRILEVSTSHGYSTLWLADAAKSSG